MSVANISDSRWTCIFLKDNRKRCSVCSVRLKSSLYRSQLCGKSYPGTQRFCNTTIYPKREALTGFLERRSVWLFFTPCMTHITAQLVISRASCVMGGKNTSISRVMGTPRNRKLPKRTLQGSCFDFLAKTTSDRTLNSKTRCTQTHARDGLQ